MGRTTITGSEEETDAGDTFNYLYAKGQLEPMHRKDAPTTTWKDEPPYAEKVPVNIHRAARMVRAIQVFQLVFWILVDSVLAIALYEIVKHYFLTK
jgi:hypothetical protein